MRFHLGLTGALATLALGAWAKPPVDGIQFQCQPASLAPVVAEMGHWLKALDVPASAYVVEVDQREGTATYTLKTPATDTNTLTLHELPELRIKDELLLLPAATGKSHAVSTVSRKEIVLSLMQHGRLSVFAGRACQVQALVDHVELRQHIVAWAENLEWGWPDGGPAKWNTRYWHQGTPLKRRPLDQALLDAFTHQQRYAIGCYTATKLVIVQGVADYYQHKKGLADLIRSRLMVDSEPLVHVEPGDMWSFESYFDADDKGRAGKLLRLQQGVAAMNFVPGDWVYMVNTDPGSRTKTGYEGSNALYLGRNRFDDYYNDNDHAYTYQQKLDEVYQWRHGVFSRTRDHDKIHPLSAGAMTQLSQPPSRGGLVLDYRVTPYLFGYEDLPTVATH